MINDDYPETIRFSPADVPPLPELADDKAPPPRDTIDLEAVMGFRPIGGEW